MSSSDSEQRLGASTKSTALPSATSPVMRHGRLPDSDGLLPRAPPAIGNFASENHPTRPETKPAGRVYIDRVLL